MGPVLDAARGLRARLRAPMARPLRHARPLPASIRLTRARRGTENPDMAITYSSYLKLDELLALQECASEGPEHDETLFIVIHQVYELWFKELLHELDFL